MPTFRYTLNGSYNAANSGQAQFSGNNTIDDPEVFRVVNNSSGFYLRANAADYTSVYAPASRGLNPATDGIFVDVSDREFGGLYGGAQGDVFRTGITGSGVYGGGGNDVMQSGPGGDRFDGQTGIDTASYEYSTAGVAIDLASGLASGGYAQSDTLLRVESLRGSVHDDALTGDTGINVLEGGAGVDILSGQGGDDSLFGQAGTDVLNGGIGNDRLDGGTGADTMTGGDGNDIYFVDSATDRVRESGVGTDTVYANVSYALADGQSVEYLRAGIGAPGLSLTGNDGANTIVGGAGDDAIVGGGAADSVFGFDGADIVSGGADNDRLDGGAANDVVIGGAGLDQMFGGTGADTFEFQDLSDSAASTTRDVINDFSRAQGDKIDLSLIDASTTTAGDQDFTFIGTGAFTKQAGQLRTVKSSTNLIVEADVDGNSAADFSVTLRNTASLIADDLVL